MNPRSLSKAIEICAKANVNLMVWGEDGIGKSEIVEGTADQLGYHVIDLRLATQEVSDIVGMPMRSRDEDGTSITEWAAPSWVQEMKREDALGRPTLLHLDELNRSTLETKQAIYQVVLKKQLHTHILPESCRIVVSSNYVSSEYDVDTIDASLLSRFAHVKLDTAIRDWIKDYAEVSDVHLDVIRFLGGSPNYLSRRPKEEFDANSVTSNRPRTWDFFSKLYRVLNEEGQMTSDSAFSQTLLSGTVGAGPCSEMLNSIREGWATIEDILSGKKVWKDVADNNTAGVRLAYQVQNTFQYKFFSTHGEKKFSRKETKTRKDRLAKFIIDCKGSKADLAMGMVKGLYRTGNDNEPSLKNWMLEEEKIGDLVLKVSEEMQAIGVN